MKVFTLTAYSDDSYTFKGLVALGESKEVLLKLAKTFDSAPIYYDLTDEESEQLWCDEEFHYRISEIELITEKNIQEIINANKKT